MAAFRSVPALLFAPGAYFSTCSWHTSPCAFAFFVGILVDTVFVDSMDCGRSDFEDQAGSVGPDSKSSIVASDCCLHCRGLSAVLLWERNVRNTRNAKQRRKGGRRYWLSPYVRVLASCATLRCLRRCQRPESQNGKSASYQRLPKTSRKTALTRREKG